MENNKETIEEASKHYAHNWFEMHETNNYKALKQGFIAGAKWQAERMYSQEEVNEIIAETWLSCEDNEGDETFTNARERIIRQFKKN